MAETIDLTPQQLDLKLYSGDGIRLPVSVVDKDNNPVNLTGVLEAQIRTRRGVTGIPQAQFTIDTSDAVNGNVVLTLTGEDCQALAPEKTFKGVWDFQWTPSGSEPRTLVQGKVECDVDVTR